MDPETDTPERLKTWAAQHGLRKGWTLVTGGKGEMAKLVGHLSGNPLGRLEMHSSFIYNGNEFSGQLYINTSDPANTRVRIGFSDTATGAATAQIESARYPVGGGYLSFITRLPSGGHN